MKTKRTLVITDKDGNVTRIKYGKKHDCDDFSVSWKKSKDKNVREKTYEIVTKNNPDFSGIEYVYEERSAKFLFIKYSLIIGTAVLVLGAVASLLRSLAELIGNIFTRND